MTQTELEEKFNRLYLAHHKLYETIIKLIDHIRVLNSRIEALENDGVIQDVKPGTNRPH